MLVNHALQILRRDVVVPDAIRLHTEDRPAPAGGEAGNPAALDAQISLIQSSNFENCTGIVEKRLRFASSGATRAGAYQQVAAIIGDAGFLDGIHAVAASVFSLSFASSASFALFTSSASAMAAAM